MSTEHRAILGIGRRFSEESEVEAFLNVHTLLDTEQIESMLEGNMGYMGLRVILLNCISGDDWFVGFEIGGDEPDTLINNVVDAHERWDAVFKVPPRVVHAVKVW